MKTPIFAAIFSIISLFGAASASAQERAKPKLRFPNLGLTKLSKVPAKPPHYLAPFPDDLVCCKEKRAKVVKVKTVELSRTAFTKWEEHCCGIKMKGNYMRVVYKTIYSDGTEVVFDKVYRS